MTQGVRLLLVEDDELFRLGLVMTLQKAGFAAVGEAVDGETALQMATNLAPDLVLLDIGLPGLDGAEICQLLHAAHPNLPILVLTSHLEDALAVELLQAGAKGYCLKGIGSQTLVLALNSLLRGGSWWSGAAIEQIRQYTMAAPELASPEEPTAPELANLEQRPQPKPISPKLLWPEQVVKLELTDREQEILSWLARGANNQEIAQALYISLSTVRVHVHSILRKLQVRDRTQAALFAVKHNLVQQAEES